MNTAKRVPIFLAGAIALCLFPVGCGGDGESGPPPGGGTTSCADVDTNNYQAFDASNYANQFARVDAYEAIKAGRKASAFSAADFGDLAATDPANTSPSDETFASLYVETAELAGKVAGRVDDHGYKLSYDLMAGGKGEVGAYLDELIRDAIEQGAAAAAVERDAVGSIDWYGQIVDKALQHFFYLSVHHEMVAGARKNWDEAFGYYGRDTDGGSSEGIAATVASRDDNCGLGINDEIFAKLVQGQCELAAAIDAAGTDSIDPASVPALQNIIDDIDLLMLTSFAISCARELRDLPTSGEPTIKLIEGRIFFGIIEPFMASKDAAAAASVRAELSKDDPSQVDTASSMAAIIEVFGLEQTFAGCN